MDNIIYNIYPFFYNHIYGKPMAYLKHGIILFRLREISKYTKQTIIKRFYRMQTYKAEQNQKQIYLNNMKIIAKASEDMGIPFHVLVASWKPEKHQIIHYKITQK